MTVSPTLMTTVQSKLASTYEHTKWHTHNICKHECSFGHTLNLIHRYIRSAHTDTHKTSR